MLKVATLVACIIGFLFLGPKVVAEFRRARGRTKKNGTSVPSSRASDRAA